MNLWNANCDSRNPKSKQTLLRDLEVWEKTQGGRASTTPVNVNLQVSGSTDSAKTDQNANDQAMSARDVDTFRTLIAQAKQRKAAAQKANENRTETPSEQTKTEGDKAEEPTEINEKHEGVGSTNGAEFGAQGNVLLLVGTNAKETGPSS